LSVVKVLFDEFEDVTKQGWLQNGAIRVARRAIPNDVQTRVCGWHRAIALILPYALPSEELDQFGRFAPNAEVMCPCGGLKISLPKAEEGGAICAFEHI
jgi:hypothetical protein